MNFDGQISLATVLQKVPYFSALLSPDDWGAVLGCNRSCRDMVHDFASTIFLENPKHLAAVLQGQWPQLTLIVLCNSPVNPATPWPWLHNEFHLVATVALSDSTLSALALVVVSKSRYQQLTREHVQRCIADACLYLSNQIWRRLDRLDVKHVYRFTKLQVIAPLLAIRWPNLTCLDLSLLKLGSAGLAHLVQGSWPVLRILDLQGNKLDTAAAELLCTGDWPELRALYLCHNDLGDAAMRFLAEGQWPRLEILLLHGNAIGTSGIGELMQGNWIDLRYFSLDFSWATAANCNMLHLKAVPSMWLDSGLFEKLYFSSGAAVLRHAPLGCWPALVKVHFVPSLSTHLFVGFVMIPVGLLVLSASPAIYAAIYSAKVAFSVFILASCEASAQPLWDEQVSQVSKFEQLQLGPKLASRNL